MSETPIVLLACPPDLSASQAAAGWLPAPRPGCRLILAVDRKVDVPSGVEMLNLRAGYPSELARIESFETMLGSTSDRLTATADSLAIFAVWRLLNAHRDVLRVAILRKEFEADPACFQPAFVEQDLPFAQLAQDPEIILFDRSQRGANLALSLALDTALSGAICALGEAALITVLEQAQEIALSAAFEGLIGTADASLGAPDLDQAPLRGK